MSALVVSPGEVGFDPALAHTYGFDPTYCSMTGACRNNHIFMAALHLTLNKMIHELLINKFVNLQGWEDT